MLGWTKPGSENGREKPVFLRLSLSKTGVTQLARAIQAAVLGRLPAVALGSASPGGWLGSALCWQTSVPSLVTLGTRVIRTELLFKVSLTHKELELLHLH